MNEEVISKPVTSLKTSDDRFYFSGFVPLETRIFSLKDVMSSVDDGFHNEQINSEKYGKLKNETVISSTETEIVRLSEEKRLEDFMKVGECPKENHADYPVTSGSPIFKFIAPLYPIPFTKVVGDKSFSGCRFSSSNVTDRVIEEKTTDEVLRTVSFSAASNHSTSVSEPVMCENAFNQSPSFVCEDRRTSRVKFLTSTVANDKNRKMIPPPSFSFDETAVDRPYEKPSFPTLTARTTKVQTSFATTSDQIMTSSFIQNRNFTMPPYKATVKISRSAEPQRVNFATVGLTIKTSNLSVEQQRGAESFSSKITMHVSPVSYVYKPFNITCKLCRRDT
uniref:Uncharacterized protein n=1 Tax=Romanomermis culicivorax TaxID=13658 RepID=A0A915HFD7_ROMCU